MTGAVSFHIDREATGVDEIEDNGGTQMIYDLNGTRYTEKPSTGIYIQEGRLKVQR